MRGHVVNHHSLRKIPLREFLCIAVADAIHQVFHGAGGSEVVQATGWVGASAFVVDGGDELGAEVGEEERRRVWIHGVDPAFEVGADGEALPDAVFLGQRYFTVGFRIDHLEDGLDVGPEDGDVVLGIGTHTHDALVEAEADETPRPVYEVYILIADVDVPAVEATARCGGTVLLIGGLVDQFRQGAHTGVGHVAGDHRDHIGC